jgi:hypothetical protein
LLSLVPPLPSWRSSFSPQQDTRRVPRTAQVCSAPAEIFVAFVSPLTATGVVLFPGAPLPSSPLAFSPQHATAPLTRSAHVCP